MALFGLGKKKDPYHDRMMTLLVHKPDADKLPLVIDVETGETIAKSIAFTMKADTRRIALMTRSIYEIVDNIESKPFLFQCLLKKNEKGAEIKVSIETIELSNIYCDKVLKNKEHIDYVAFIEHWYPNSIVGRYTFTETGEDGTLLCMDMETYDLVQFKPDYVLCSNLAEGDEIVVWKILLDANLKENSQSETKIIYCVTK